MNGALRVYLVPDLDIDLSQRSRLSDAMNHLETVAEVDLRPIREAHQFISDDPAECDSTRSTPA
jgi:hypothetical protein